MHMTVVSWFTNFPLRKLACFFIWIARLTPYEECGTVKHMSSRAPWGCSIVIYIQRKICTFALNLFTFSENRFLMRGFTAWYRLTSAIYIWVGYGISCTEGLANQGARRKYIIVHVDREKYDLSRLENGVFSAPEITCCHPLFLFVDSSWFELSVLISNFIIYYISLDE